jgi:hypothetical protein
MTALDRPHMLLSKSKGPYTAAAYDRDQQVLELWTNTGDAFQYAGVSLELAREFAKAERPVEFLAHRLKRVRFSRVRRPR